MADSTLPLVEQYSLGGAAPLKKKQFDNLQTTTEAVSSFTAEGESSYKPAISEICEASESPAAKDAQCNFVRVSGGCTEQQTPPNHCVLAPASTSPSALSDSSSTQPAPLPVHRSHSDCLPVHIQGVNLNVKGSKTSALDGHQIQTMETTCKPMPIQQLQLQRNTICGGVINGEGGAQMHPSGCVCVSPVKAEIKVESEDVHPSSRRAGLPVCCGSSVHHAVVEETFAPCCHPGSIPAPPQLLPRLVAPSCNIQHMVAPSPAANHLSLPRLISSVSETGLDAKHLLRCCNLNCSWISAQPPGTIPPSPQYINRDACCYLPASPVQRTTRDMGTMTSHHVLKEAGVQTSQAVSSHVFPEICLLAEESSGGTPNAKTPKNDSKKGKKSGVAPKEVKWDAEGMTWEVYGASVDPEELGLAIQKHLELQIKETATRAAKLTRENSSPPQQTGHQRKRSRMMSSLCGQGCCSGRSSTVD